MNITRRDFIKWVAASAAALGLSSSDIFKLEEALASEATPMIWLQGALCTGCSISLLNTVNPTIDDVLLNKVSMKFHPNLNSAAGELAISTVTAAAVEKNGEFILCVEGGIPTNINGNYCIIGEKEGKPWTVLDALNELGPKAKYVISVGTCAAFGGVVKPSEYTGIKSVQEILKDKTLNPVINLPACPVNPITLVGTLVTLLTTGLPDLDHEGRPLAYYNTTVHMICPRHHTPMVDQIGVFGCYKHVGCKGPHVTFTCPRLKWNNGVNWCIDRGNTVCIGCASPNFPAGPFYVKGGECSEMYDSMMGSESMGSGGASGGTDSGGTSGGTGTGGTDSDGH